MTKQKKADGPPTTVGKAPVGSVVIVQDVGRVRILPRLNGWVFGRSVDSEGREYGESFPIHDQRVVLELVSQPAPGAVGTEIDPVERGGGS